MCAQFVCGCCHLREIAVQRIYTSAKKSSSSTYCVSCPHLGVRDSREQAGMQCPPLMHSCLFVCSSVDQNQGLQMPLKLIPSLEFCFSRVNGEVADEGKVEWLTCAGDLSKSWCVLAEGPHMPVIAGFSWKWDMSSSEQWRTERERERERSGMGMEWFTKGF